MFSMQVRRFKLAAESRHMASEHFKTSVSHIRQIAHPFLDTIRAKEAQLLGVDASSLDFRPPTDGYGISNNNPNVDCEIFVGEKFILILALENVDYGRVISRDMLPEGKARSDALLPKEVWLYAMGSPTFVSILDQVSDIVDEQFGAQLEVFTYSNRRFRDIASEVTVEQIEISDERLRAAKVLEDKSSRTLAIAIKSSGGLLLTDLPKQLPSTEQTQASSIKDALVEGGLASTETVVICSASNAQVIRIDRKDSLPELASQGVKCACGKPISEETVTEFLSITSEGRFLLDKSRWMSILVKRELVESGVSPEDILLECQIGSDEIDCIANLAGDTAMFELKDNEFSLGHAYSFGAKMGLIRPQRAVVITTAHVASDVKEHFRRSIGTPRARPHELISPSESTTGVIYIEGVEKITEGISQIVGGVYRRRAAGILDDALSLMKPLSESILQVITGNGPDDGGMGQLGSHD
jgi:hypothetical protein